MINDLSDTLKNVRNELNNKKVDSFVIENELEKIRSVRDKLIELKRELCDLTKRYKKD